jgi:hypothetical protein
MCPENADGGRFISGDSTSGCDFVMADGNAKEFGSDGRV